MIRFIFLSVLMSFVGMSIPMTQAQAGAVINEIAWMGTAADYHDEWIELAGDAHMDLTGWILSIEGKKEIFLEGVIPAGGFFVVRRPDDEKNPSQIPTDLFASFGSGLANAGEILVLRNASGNEVDRVNGSDNWKISGGNEPVGNNNTKETAQRTVDGWRTAVPTPHVPNKAESSLPASTSVTTPPFSPQPAPPPSSAPPTAGSSGKESMPLLLPHIEADAGEDQTAVAGSRVSFVGSAIGLKKQPLEGARFWWNFGDGETQEGSHIGHIFRTPGTYIVGLHVSSGEHSASDYVTIRIVANQIRVSGVLEGKEGYIQFFNPLNMDIDIGDWALEDGSGKKFFLPPKTTIGAGADFALTNDVMGLMQGAIHYPLTIRYPNGALALTYIPVVASSSPRDRIGTKTIATTRLEEKPITPATIYNNNAQAPILRDDSAISPAKQRAGLEEKSSPIVEQGSEEKKQTAEIGGSPLSSRMLFAGAAGLSVFAGAGYILLKRSIGRSI